MEDVALMDWFFFIFAQWHRHSKPDFNQGCQLLLYSAGLLEKFLQVWNISLCDRNTVSLIFSPALPIRHRRHYTGHRNASQFRVAFFSPCPLRWHTHGDSAQQIQHSKEAFLKSNLNPLLSCVDGKKCWNNTETRGVPAPQKRGITLLHLPKWP